MNRADVLVEIGTEELPPRALPALAQAFEAGVCAGLDAAALAHGASHRYATPRRLAVCVEGVAAAQPDRLETRRGPALAAAFDTAGQPTAAARGFARGCGVAVEALERLETDKGAWLAYRHTVAGRSAGELLPDIVRAALADLPIARRMRWGEGRVEFVRPVHWVLLLVGDRAVDAEILGIRAAATTRGHRFHHPDPLPIAAPRDYARILRAPGRVIADLVQRREAVRSGVETAAAGCGGRALIDPALLDEVTALVEWPVALAGSFDAEFLRLPREALIATLTGHQRYFPVEGADGALLPAFVTVSNIESRDPAQVVAGNERVTRPRLADAAFFWDQDRRTPLAARREGLRTIVFQEGLGSLYDKSERVAALATELAPGLGADTGAVRRAAQLGKCDLLTEMVGEFPELQGVMGRHYALHDGEPEAAALAIDEQYRPRHAGDTLPEHPEGTALALAERLDTLVGIFAAGLRPSGDKDPFALRRAAIGVLRILIEGGHDLDVEALLARAAAGYADFPGASACVPEVVDFILERLRAYYSERGVAPDVFEAVRACRPTRPADFDRRVRAVTVFRALPEAASLSAANKRLRNLLRQAEHAGGGAVDEARLETEEERALYEARGRVEAEVEPLLATGDYERALRVLATLRTPVDAFFEAVMVMVPDTALRANRLALLESVGALFLRIADISRLQG